MADHLTEQEQMEMLKRWWKERGAQTLLLVVLGVGGWFGWHQWQDYSERKAQQASLLYDEMLTLATTTDELNPAQRARLNELADALKENHGRSQYARYAGLALARLAVLDQDLETAETELRAVMQAAEDELAAVAGLRLARVLAARGAYGDALTVLDQDVPNALASQYAEVRGDIQMLSGDFVAARAAYQLALDTLGAPDDNARAILELKLNQVLLGDVTPQSDSDVVSEENAE